MMHEERGVTPPTLLLRACFSYVDLAALCEESSVMKRVLRDTS